MYVAPASFRRTLLRGLQAASLLGLLVLLELRVFLKLWLVVYDDGRPLILKHDALPVSARLPSASGTVASAPR